ncbi:MAG: isoprenyl transferase [Rhodospirillales bacterium]|nr:isoprenyl transferase [Alphaproteobacteria bacterium]MCB9987376.1 isoprenyl transferase [Rhodospirillales bacterium]USO07777.1 MAG: isoprenyl transferase [Rhodospirillales bacterium]
MNAISPDTLPAHVAVIMDGNGRWARMRGLPRTAGHKAGVDATRRTVRAASEMGIRYLTLFGFSTENWSRPKGEIFDLMGLLRLYLRAEAADLHRAGVRLRVIGRRDRLDADIVEMIMRVEELTRENTGLNLTIALDYGGRQEIVAAVQALMRLGYGPEMVDEDALSRQMMTAALPDPDLLIRTSGEERISNFLLWQCAYTEFHFTDVLWPDFSKENLEAAVAAYAGRQRRFGGVETDDPSRKRTV